MEEAKRPARRFFWLYDVLVLLAVWFLYGPLLGMGRSVGFGEMPWPPSTALGVFLVGVYAVSMVGMGLKLPGQSQRIHGRAKEVETNGFNRFMRRDGMLLILLAPLLGQFVLWFFILTHGLENLGVVYGTVAGYLAFVFILVGTLIPCWATWRLIAVDEGDKPPFSQKSLFRHLEVLGDLLLAIAGILLLVPVLSFFEAISGEGTLESFFSADTLGTAMLTVIVVSLFYAAPRLPLLIEELPKWQSCLRFVVVLIVFNLGLFHGL